MSQKPQNKKSPLGVESLERRDLMAGNVTVKFGGDGDLTITGDSAANRVVLERVDYDTFRVRGETTGGAATRINGVANGSFTFPTSKFNDDVRVSLGAGHDMFYVKGRGPDSLLQFLDVPDQLAIDMGSGNDYVSLKYMSAMDILISDGTGNDDLYAFNVDVLDDFIVSDSTATTSSSRNTYQFQSVFVDDELRIDTFGGADEVIITNTITDRLAVSLGAGGDRLNIRESRAFVSSDLNGGTGTDLLNTYSNVGISTRGRNFEKFSTLNKPWVYL